MKFTTTDKLPQYAVEGAGETTVFLLHGAYGGGAYFEHTAGRLADEGYRTVVWNAPGYGGTALPDSMTIPRYAEALTDLIGAIGGSHNVVLGHSMGALIAPLACGRHPLVHGLVLSGASAGFASRSPEDQERYLAERLGPIEQGKSVAEYVAPLLSSMLGPGAEGPLVDRVREVIIGMETATLASSIKAIAGYEGRPALREIAKPTLLIAGTDDPACPVAGMRKIHEMVAGSRIHEIDGAGHYGFASHAEEYEAQVLQFLEGLPAGGSSQGADEGAVR